MTDPDNLEHLHRHACHALEDFGRLRSGIAEDRFWPHEIEERMHAISHHLRHVVYRVGLEVKANKRVRRHAQHY